MRIAALADLHLTSSKDDTNETLDEQVERLRWIANDAEAHEIELIVVAGDTFHARSNADERNAAIHVYQGFAKIAPVVVVRGNHDQSGDLEFLGQLRSDNTIEIAERPRVIDIGGKGLVLAMPYPAKNFLAADAAREGVDPRSMTERATQALRALFLHWAATNVVDSFVPVALVGHLELGSAELDSGQPATGRCFIETSLADLAELGADVNILGHIHKRQQLDDRTFYVGSPRQTTFGEDSTKGYCLVDVNKGELPCIEHRKAPGPQLVTVHAEMVDGVLVIPPTTGADIMRLVYDVPDSQRQDAARQAAEWSATMRKTGARSVKLDARTITTTRARSHDLHEAKTNTDRLRAYWAARDMTPDRACNIAAKLAEIEEVQS